MTPCSIDRFWIKLHVNFHVDGSGGGGGGDLD